MRLGLLFGAAALVCTLSSVSQAQQEDRIFNPNDDWKIGVTPDGGCYMEAQYSDGLRMRIGQNMDANANNAYILVGKETWTQFGQGDQFKLQVQFDREPTWDADTMVEIINGVPVLIFFADNDRFIYELAQKYVMNMSYQGRALASASLRGSEQAVKRVADCQDAANAGNIENFARTFNQNKPAPASGFGRQTPAPGNGVRFGVGNDPWNNVYNPPATFRVTTDVNVRQSPQNGSPVIGTIPRGDTGLVTRMVNGWYEVADDNGNPFGYVYKKFLTPH